MRSREAKDMEKHLAGQIDDLLGRFLPIASMVVDRTELAMILVNCGLGITGTACANIAANSRDGLEPIAVGVLVAGAHKRLDEVALAALDAGTKRKSKVAS